MKRAIFSLLFLLILVYLSGQKTDLIHLKNGSQIRGSIIELIPDESVRIKDGCGNIIVYQLAEVEKITAEEVQSDRPVTYSGFKSGLANISSIGVLAGSVRNEQTAPFSIQSTLGWRSASGLMLGGGAGIEFIQSTHLPLFLDLRYDLSKSSLTPVLIGKAGYAVPMQKHVQDYNASYNYSGGLLASLGVGLKIRSREGLAWDISVLYRFQQINYTLIYDYMSFANEYSENYNRIELRVGLYLD